MSITIKPKHLSTEEKINQRIRAVQAGLVNIAFRLSKPTPATGVYRGKKIYARGSKTKCGRATGGSRRCQLESCNGMRIRVIWPDGKSTWPCSKGLEKYKDGLRIM